MLIGIASGVAPRKLTTGLSGWEELLIVVVGSIIAAALLGLGKWLWDRWNDPRLIIQCGNDDDGYYETQILETEELIQKWARGDVVEGAWGKLLAVRETHGRHARNVAVSVVEVESPGKVYELPITLKWLDWSEVTDIGPKNHKRFFLQLVLATNQANGERLFMCQTPIDSSTPQTVTLEVRVAGRPNRTMRFCVHDPWPDPLNRYGRGPLPTPFPFPRVEALVEQPKDYWWKR